MRCGGVNASGMRWNVGVCQRLVHYRVVGLAGEIGGLERVIGRGSLPTPNYSMVQSCPLTVRVRNPGAVRSSSWGCREGLELYFWGLFLRRLAFFAFIPSASLFLLQLVSG